MTQTLGHDGQLLATGQEPDLVTWLGGVLALVAVIELTVLRIGTRTIIHIPGIEAFETPYRGISTFGRTAYFVAVVLLLAILVVAVASLVAKRAVGAAVVVAGVCLAGIAARADLVGGEVVAALTVVCITVLSFRLISNSTGYARFAIAALGAAPIVALSTMLIVEVFGAGTHFERAGLTVGEGLAVAAALLSPLLVVGSRPRRSSWIIAGVVGLVVLMMILGAGSTTKILMLWNFGLSGYFPGPFYALAAAALGYTIATLLAEGRQGVAVGLTLLLVGGIGLHSTYQTGLVVVGFALLDLSMIETSEPERVPVRTV